MRVLPLIRFLNQIREDQQRLQRTIDQLKGSKEYQDNGTVQVVTAIMANQSYVVSTIAQLVCAVLEAQLSDAQIQQMDKLGGLEPN